METYSVKQIAEMLDTNPETVRRWIRDKKLKAVQVSRKSGNIITETELRRFLKATPKYLPKASTNMTSFSPAVGFATLASTFVAGTVIGYLSEKNNIDIRVRPEDFKAYLNECILKYQNLVRGKRLLIAQAKEEIATLEKQIEQYRYLIEHDELISKTIAEAMEKKINEEG